MNERQLQSFIIAADSKSFTKAADLSSISTPAFVQQINLLEENIGFSLFKRTHRGISLTPSGESFYDAAKKIIKIYDTACKNGIALEKARTLSLKISYPLEQFPAFLLPSYEEFRTHYPYANIDFLPISFNDHISAVTNGIVDLSVIAEPSEQALNGLDFYPLGDDTYSFCMRPNHPLAKNTFLTKELLNGVNIICGNYNYLKKSFYEQLKDLHANLKIIDKEYDMSIRTERMLSDEIFVIHSLWSQPYESFLRVIPSNISAGRVGAIYCNPPSKAVQNFLPYLKHLKN